MKITATMKKIYIIIIFATLFLNMCAQGNQNNKEININHATTMKFNPLTPEEERVIINKGTEVPYTGEYLNNEETGTYICKRCETPLYRSTDKFDGHCGWPSFDDAIDGTIEFVKDTSHGMVRTETLCANCGSHLGHIFNDGPTETGQRYCINSLSLEFKEEQ